MKFSFSRCYTCLTLFPVFFHQVRIATQLREMREAVGTSDSASTDFVGGIAQLDFLPAKDTKRAV
jgi:hypothetical protein